jgi:peptidoglycan hydrolase-like protein with peptidoglycan-binding domain
MLGSEGEVEPPSGLLGEPSSRLPGDMRGISHRRRLWLPHRLVSPSTWLRPSSTASLCDKRRALRPSFPQTRGRGAPGNTGFYAASPPPRRGSCTQCLAPNGRGTGALAPVHARERDRPEAAQFLLRAKGHHVAVDGIFGPITEAAVNFKQAKAYPLPE